MTGEIRAQDRGAPRFGPLLSPDTVTADPDVLGRVWSLADLPAEVGRLLDSKSLASPERRRMLRGTVRLPHCSGAFVSNRGLILTADRCVRGHLSQKQKAKPVHASSRGQERRLSGMHVDRLVEIDDVSARIDSLRRGTAARADEPPMSLQEAIQHVEQRLSTTEAQRHIDVVPEAGGERFVAYTFRRYTDVRLVFRPDPDVARYGQEDDLLSYPTSAWDVAFLRVYDDDGPLQTTSHFRMRPEGAQPGESVFALGYPSQTRRIETHRQHEFRRDVTLPARHRALESWSRHLQTYVDTASAASSKWTERLWRAQRDEKRAEARLEALQSDYVMRHLRTRDARLRRRAEKDSDLGKEVEDVLSRLARLQEKKRALATSYRAFSFLRREDNRSSTFARALIASRGPQRNRDSVEEALQSVPRQPAALDAALLSDHIDALRSHLDVDNGLQRALQRLDEPSRIIQQSVFSDPDSTRALLRSGTDIEDDPGRTIAAAVAERYRTFQHEWKTLQNQEHALVDTLARLRYRLHDRPLALPQSRALRVANGRIAGYSYNATVAPPMTTFHGLFAQFASHEKTSASSLPPEWRSPSPTFDRSTPLMTVADTDMMGEYGGPLVDASLRLVGLHIDDNVQAAAGTYLFLPSRMRTVAVDVRGILAGLSHIYDAEALVQELTGGEFSAK